MKFVYYDDDFLAKITRKAERISADFDHGLQNWQVWQMVATIESGKAQRTHYQEDAEGRTGIIVEGWNTTPNPQDRWAENERLRNHWQFDLVYEKQHRVWGYRARNEYRNEADAQEAAKAARQDSWCRRAQVDYSEMTGFWWLRIETTRKPKDSEWKHVRRCRINDTGKELTDE